MESVDSAAHDSGPSPRARIIVAVAIATLAVLVTYGEHLSHPNRGTDFGIVWFGARSLAHGVNPYPLVGPGLTYQWDWYLLYPATSMIVAMPLSVLREFPASVAFVWISAAILAYVITAQGWNRLFLFASAPFIIAAGAAQWSPLFCAVICRPALGWLLAAKPNLGVAIAGTSSSGRLVISALVGAVGLTAISLLLLPSWPRDWLLALRHSSHMIVPILRPGGFLVLLALLRWRRSEARLIIALACVPQTGSWYEALPLLTVPVTRRECQLLSLLASLGYLLSIHFVPQLSEAQINKDVGTFMVAFAYLPAVLVVLRRKNEGEPPVWLLPFLKRRAVAASVGVNTNPNSSAS